MTYLDDLPRREDRDCDDCRHRSPEHCPCETIEEVELTDEEFNAIVDALNGETTWPPKGN